MKNHSYISMQQDMPDQGQLQVTVLDSASNRPVENATVRISYTGVPDNVIEEIRTDSSGKTPMLELAARKKWKTTAGYIMQKDHICIKIRWKIWPGRMTGSRKR